MSSRGQSSAKEGDPRWKYERMNLPLELMDRVNDVGMAVHFRDACRAQEPFLEAWERWQESLPLDQLTTEEQHTVKNAACTCYEDVLWADASIERRQETGRRAAAGRHAPPDDDGPLP